MQQAYKRPTARIVSRKSNLQLAYDCRVRQKKCHRILKHVLKLYDNRNHSLCPIARVVRDFLHDTSSERE